jgi:hypothetical protein
MIIYHASPTQLASFGPTPAWFSTNTRDAAGWHKAGGQVKSYTHICTFAGVIAPITTVVELAKRVWPNDEFIYSMLDPHIGEFEVSKIEEFVRVLKVAGFDAAYVEDYDPHDFEHGRTISMCVLNPSSTVQVQIFME